MSTEVHLNAPAKGCGNCFHCHDRLSTGYAKCARFGFHYTVDAIKVCNSTEWRPIQPRRSLRRWLYDTLWA